MNKSSLVDTKKTKYLTFYKTMIKGKKTFNIYVFNKEEDVRLGQIHWLPAWRTYVFEVRHSLFDIKCLKEITDYIQELLNERKNKK